MSQNPVQKHAHKKLDAIIFLLFIGSVFFLPFNDIYRIFYYCQSLCGDAGKFDISSYWLYRAFREMGRGAAFYPLLCGVVLLSFRSLLVKDWRFKINAGVMFFIAFLIWVIFSGVVNIAPIFAVAEKAGRSGTLRFISQLLLLVFFIAVYQSIYQIGMKFGKTDVFRGIERAAVASFVVSAIFVLVVELPQILGFAEAGSLISVLKNASADPGRVHGLSGEPSWFGIYLAFVTPWILVSRTLPSILRVGLTALLAVFVVFSFSRTAYIMLLAEAGVAFLLLLFADAQIRKKYLPGVVVYLGVFFFFVFYYTNPQIDGGKIYKSLYPATMMDDSSHVYSISNKTRLGTQVAAIGLALDNPIFGVGFGQAPFYVAKYLPSWSISKETQEYYRTDYWGSVHGLYARILAELGFLGLTIWVGLFGVTFYCLSLRKFKEFEVERILLISLLTGVFLSGGVIESYRFFEISIAFACVWIYLDKSGAIPSEPGITAK